MQAMQKFYKMTVINVITHEVWYCIAGSNWHTSVNLLNIFLDPLQLQNGRRRWHILSLYNVHFEKLNKVCKFIEMKPNDGLLLTC